MTSLVSNPDKFKLMRDLQPANIPTIPVTFFVSNPDRSRLTRLLQLENI